MSIFINAYEIFENQIEAGQAIFQALIDRKSKVLTAQMQQGKTGSNIFAIAKLLEFFKINNVKGKILYCINQSDCSVKQQTEKAINKAFDNGYAGFSHYELVGRDNENRIIKILHHPDFSKINIQNQERLFIIDDECHLAINKDGLFHKFCQKLTLLNIDQSITYSSGTPFTHSIINKIFEDKFEPIILKPSIYYYGIIDFNRDKAFRANDNIFDRKTINLSKWAKEIFLQNLAEYNAKFGVGYAIWRASLSTQQKETLIRHIKNNFNLDIKISEYNNSEKNLLKLKTLLKTKPTQIEIILIKQSLRVGQNIEKEHIRQIYETPSRSNAAAPLQGLIGRVCGNNVNKNIAIFCNLDHVDAYIKWWQTINSGTELIVPSCTFSTSNIKNKTCPIYDLEWFDNWESALARAKELGQSYKHEKSGTISGNEVIDMADCILNKKNPASKHRPYELDAPSKNEEYINSWNKLVAKYPDKIGKDRYVILVEQDIGTKTTISPVTKDNIKESCMPLLN